MRLSSVMRTASELVLAAAIFAIAALVGVAVLFRYVLNAPLSFSFEGSTLIFCWVTFVGAAIASLGDHHIGVDLLGERLAPALRRIVELVRQTVVLACSCYLVWAGASLALRGRGRIPSLDLPNVWLYAALPIGFAGMAAIAASRIVALARGRRAARPSPRDLA